MSLAACWYLHWKQRTFRHKNQRLQFDQAIIILPLELELSNGTTDITVLSQSLMLPLSACNVIRNHKLHNQGLILS